MDTHQFYDRKQYVEQVRSSFSGSGEKRNASYATEQENDAGEVRSFFKLRFVLAVVVFLAFLFFQQADISYEDITAADVVKQIRSTISLPDSVPKLEELIHVE